MVYEFQKLITSIVLVVIVVVAINKVSNIVFKKCAACHSINEGGKNKIGPALWAVMSRKSGELKDYKYSKALLDYDKTWNFIELNGFLLKPSTWIKGNKMGFAGLKNDKDRASVILYLNESSNNILPLP